MEIETFEGTTTLSLSLFEKKLGIVFVVQFSVRGELRLHGVRVYRKISLKRGDEDFAFERNHPNETFPIRKVAGITGRIAVESFDISTVYFAIN